MEKWTWICPICNKSVTEDYDVEYIRGSAVGCTHDCPECGGLLMIQDDATLIDFGEELVKRYAEMGLNISKEEATGSYVEL